MLLRFFSFSLLFTLISCVPQSRIAIAPMDGYTANIDMNYAETFEILLNHISSDYIVQDIDRDRGIIRANFKSRTPRVLVDCGNLINQGVQ